MSQIRRMIAAMPENHIIKGVFKITSATTAYPVVYSNDSLYDYAIVDGEIISTPESSRTWSVGEHRVKLKLKNTASNFAQAFYGLPYTSLDFSHAGGVVVSSLSEAFRGCNQLTSLDLSGLCTNSNNSLYRMCYSDSLLENINYGDTWNTSNVTDMRAIFAYCKKLGNMDLTSWDTSKMKQVDSIFQDTLCKTINVSGWNLSACRWLQYLFMNNHNLETVDISGWDVSKVTNAGYWFTSCENLVTVKVVGCPEVTINKALGSLKYGTWTLTDGILNRS